MKLEFSRQICVKYLYQISRQSVQWELSCSLRTDGQADTTKPTAAFRDFANAPKMNTRITISVESRGRARVSMKFATLRRYRSRLL